MPTFSKEAKANTSFSGADMLATLMIDGTSEHNGAVCTLGDLQTLSYSLHMERGAVRSLGSINAKDHTSGPRTIAGSLVFAVFDRHMTYKVLKQMGITDPVLADEMPPFNVTISFASEYGHQSVLRIYDIRLINEGEVLSVNDIYTENTYQYVARNIEVLRPDDGETSFGYLPYKEPITEDIIKEDVKVEQTQIPPHLKLEKIELQQVTFTVEGFKEIHALYCLRSDGYTLNKQVQSNQWPYVIELSAGDWVAHIDEDTKSSISFRVEPKKNYLVTPVITTITETSLIGFTNDDRTVQVVLKNGITTQKSQLSTTGVFEFNNLISDSIYYLQAFSVNDTFSSEKIKVTTASSKSELFKEFQDNFACNLSEDIRKKTDFQKIKAYYLKFPVSFVEAFAKCDAPDETLFLANYFYLITQETQFQVISPYLLEILPSTYAHRYFCLSSEGHNQNAQKTPGIVHYTQFLTTKEESLTVYNPAVKIQEARHKNYAESTKTDALQKDRFLGRYAHLNVKGDFVYLDYSNHARGAYLTLISMSNIRSSHEGYLVVRENSCSLIPLCKIKVFADTTCNLNTYHFYDKSKTYYISLENIKGERLSRGITNKFYLYDALRIYAFEYFKEALDIIDEIVDNDNLYETFLYGINLLVNRNYLLILDYIRTFQRYFYKPSLDAPISYIITDNKFLTFAEPVFYFRFNNYGELLERGNASSISISKDGYLLAYTPDTLARWISYEKLYGQINGNTEKGATLCQMSDNIRIH